MKIDSNILVNIMFRPEEELKGLGPWKLLYLATFLCDLYRDPDANKPLIDLLPEAVEVLYAQLKEAQRTNNVEETLKIDFKVEELREFILDRPKTKGLKSSEVVGAAKNLASDMLQFFKAHGCIQKVNYKELDTNVIIQTSHANTRLIPVVLENLALQKAGGRADVFLNDSLLERTLFPTNITTTGPEQGGIYHTLVNTLAMHVCVIYSNPQQNKPFIDMLPQSIAKLESRLNGLQVDQDKHLTSGDLRKFLYDTPALKELSGLNMPQLVDPAKKLATDMKKYFADHGLIKPAKNNLLENVLRPDYGANIFSAGHFYSLVTQIAHANLTMSQAAEVAISDVDTKKVGAPSDNAEDAARNRQTTFVEAVKKDAASVTPTATSLRASPCSRGATFAAAAVAVTAAAIAAMALNR
jgi:hypothetical protein